MERVKYFILVATFLSGIVCYANILEFNKDLGYFSGRVSHIEGSARLVRFKVDFDNIKYINKLDEVDLWGLHQESSKCKAIVMGRTSHYLLLRISRYDECNRKSAFSTGRYYNFYSQDLVNNVAMGNELIEILAKKKLALESKISRNKQDITTYTQRVETINARYDLLRQKLEKEWRDELRRLEDDHQQLVRNTEGIQTRLNEVDYKLQQYRIESKNLKEDRWSLDPRNYITK
ncbi:hypothetical protein ABMA79_05495 [Halobacteriovorax sp. HFRX-2_2]|uniref:hypothetical protein n=1 Tax=unclassified Halobacteriovorax TaxID=2639665 RepID=UPI00371A073C